jgi:hypothetical protein
VQPNEITEILDRLVSQELWARDMACLGLRRRGGGCSPPLTPLIQVLQSTDRGRRSPSPWWS